MVLRWLSAIETRLHKAQEIEDERFNDGAQLAVANIQSDIEPHSSTDCLAMICHSAAGSGPDRYHPLKPCPCQSGRQF